MKQLNIGIDPGTKTGMAIWNKEKKKFDVLDTLPIHRALIQVMNVRALINEVVVEDSRQKWFGGDPLRKQGAGSIKRDCSIWEAFLKDYDIPYRLVRPQKKITKLKPAAFFQITGYGGHSSEHSRDAAMLVYAS